MKRFILFALVIGTLAPASKAERAAEELVQACSELISIYAQRNEKNLLAGWATSVSDAMQAGYCRGVVDEFRRTHRACNAANWHTLARRIAKTTPASISGATFGSLLEDSCGI